jgi:hypothetical protein
MEFVELREKLRKHVAEMLSYVDNLFVVDIDKNVFYNLYLGSFPAGTNTLFRNRKEFDCSACRHFIKSFGNVVKIVDQTITTIWDFDAGDKKYQPVLDALATYIRTSAVSDVFVTDQAIFGLDKNIETLDSGKTITWHHFYCELPQKFVTRSTKTLDTIRGQFRDTRNVFKRSLEELTEDSVDTVLELTAQGSLYKGEEWALVLRKFREYQKAYAKIEPGRRDNYCWEKSVVVGEMIGRIRNHSIGVLLADISNGVDLDEAVRKYEAMVAPTNYKRPKAIYTKKMIEAAKKDIEALGYAGSLERRFATLDDITINNILFSNKDAAKRIAGSVFDQMVDGLPVNPKSFAKTEEIPIETFLKEVLPTVKNMEILLEGRHSGNMVSLIVPKKPETKSPFKWANAFSWAYSGNMTDSMRERVKAAGGKVDGVLRFSIQWNDAGDNDNDFDAHCCEPNGYHIYFADLRDKKTGGNLDVDIRSPFIQSKDGPAVENITWPRIGDMPEGNYKFYVHNFYHRGGRSGFSAEIEFDGQIFSFVYDKELHHNENVPVATVTYTKREGFKIVSSMTSQFTSRDVWGLKTNQFYPVTVALFSPNYWDAQHWIGNKHYFFMLKGCVNPESPNGFFNEYLDNDLTPHRRVFEALGSMMRVQDTDDQLSGIGFSSTQRNSIIAKITGAVSRTVKIIF